MTYRTHYRLSAIPFVLVAICLSALVSILWGPLGKLLARQWEHLPWLAIAVAVLLPLAFLCWYLGSFAEVRRRSLRVRSLLTVHEIDLRTLASAEVLAKHSGTSKRRELELLLRLEDEAGRQIWLPLNSWRDEDLVMARVLRATVERRVRIEGDPLLVKRFSKLLDSYKSWDRQVAA